MSISLDRAREITLCGITLPHKFGLLGHSDADVGMHAVTDAIYGALAQGDIGQHFPPSDPQWKGAPSDIFLAHAVQLAQDLGFQIENVDCTLICEFPKIGPHAQAMQARMAQIMGLEPMIKSPLKPQRQKRLALPDAKKGLPPLPPRLW